jgi:hypothetical protein
MLPPVNPFLDALGIPPIQVGSLPRGLPPLLDAPVLTKAPERAPAAAALMEPMGMHKAGAGVGR